MAKQNDKRKTVKSVKQQTSQSSPDPAEVASGVSPEAVASVNRAADAVQILNVRFTRTSSATSHRFGEKIPDAVTPRIGFTSPTFRVHNRALVVSSTFVFRLEQSTSDVPVFSFRADTEVVYLIVTDDGPSESDLEHFAKLNAPFNAWPYWREAVHAALNRLDLPSFPIPLLRPSEIASRLLDADQVEIKSPAR